MVVECKNHKLKKKNWGEHRPSPSSLPANEKNGSKAGRGQRPRHALEKAVMEGAPEASGGALDARQGSDDPELMPCLPG